MVDLDYDFKEKVCAVCDNETSLGLNCMGCGADLCESCQDKTAGLCEDCYSQEFED